tara:strand:- start:169 stop:636 length:468 start_codon:yes stop_codon:yes gene_type:complete
MNTKIKDLDCLMKEVFVLKKEGKTIVTCNGTFDILHKGHIAFLEEAKKQGDVLIVAINSDASVKKNKGPSRPVNSQDDRALVLAGLGSVDFVTIFDDENPIALLDEIQPDVHVNGSEYGEDCIEASTVKKHGGRMHIVNILKGYSTTSVIDKMKG